MVVKGRQEGARDSEAARVVRTETELGGGVGWNASQIK